MVLSIMFVTFQEYTLAMLAEKFGEHEDPEMFDRIQNWVAGTTPGLYDEDVSIYMMCSHGTHYHFFLIIYWTQIIMLHNVCLEILKAVNQLLH